MQYPNGFILKDSSLQCRQCQTVFAMRVLADLPPVTLLDRVEADLHRVLPHPALRGALIAVCPSCGYTDWTTKFIRSIIKPMLVLPTPDIEHCKKFAMAVKSARQQCLQPLDIAYVALNGLYCARESGQQADAWLELCVYEQSRGLESEDLAIETGSDHLVMAELWRQVGRFEQALAEYDKARLDGSVPEALLRHQINVSRAADKEPTALPPSIVQIIYPDAAELLETGAVTREALQSPLVQTPNPLFMLDYDESTGLFNRAGVEQRPAWASNTKFDIAVEPEFELDEEERAALAEAQRLVMEGLPPAPEGDEAAAQMQAAEPAILVDRQPASAQSEQIADLTPANSQPPVEPPAVPEPVQVQPQPPSAVPMSQMRQVIAVPECASTISLVHSSPAAALGVVVTAQASISSEQSVVAAQAQAALSEDHSLSNHSANANAGKQRDERAHKALSRALKVVDPSDAIKPLPDVHIFDDDHQPLPQNGSAQQAQGQPAAANKNPQEAIAQVESFLNLTRQPGYQNWIRGYRR